MNADDVATVLRLACETEDRTAAEQQAMIRTALRVDRERGSFAKSNRTPRPPSLVMLVRDTYEPSAGRRVDLDAQQRAQYDRLAEKWQRCEQCGEPLGAHVLDQCEGAP